MGTSDYKLFTPLALGDGLVLQNRIVHGPLTRARSEIETRAPLEANAAYYEQRASAGLIITESTSVSAQGHGWYGAPALYNDDQAEAWRRVVERVHARGGKIFLQVWHMGRQSHPSFHPNGDVVSASATCYEEGYTRNADGERVNFETARALEIDEIPGIVDDFRKCAERAKDVGFDGIEVNASGGYLIAQFLQSCTNQRTDRYGGSFENRVRFLLEIIESLLTVWPPHRIGVRLGPNSVYGGMGSVDNPELYTYAFEQLSKYGIAYVAIQDGKAFGFTDKCRLLTTFDVKQAFKGFVMGNVGYTRDIAEGALRSGSADLIGFGRMYMSNPDLAERFLYDWPLAPVIDRQYWWDAVAGTDGYLGHPAYSKCG